MTLILSVLVLERVMINKKVGKGTRQVSSYACLPKTWPLEHDQKVRPAR